MSEPAKRTVTSIQAMMIVVNTIIFLESLPGPFSPFC